MSVRSLRSAAIALVLGGFLLGLGWVIGAERPDAPARESAFAHMVYFELQEKTDANVEKLIAGCREYLSRHPGTVFFSVGPRAADMTRDVNDQQFDVALIIVFRNQEAHDAYQTAERHLQFIEKCKELWKGVRVFDAHVTAPPRRAAGRSAGRGAADRPAAERIPLPDPASRFAGVIRGKVESKRRGALVVLVESVVKEWEHNKAEDSRALVGKRVLVDLRTEDGRPAPALARFARVVQPGEVVDLDVAHKEGEALTLLELNEEQRERVK